MRATSIGVDVVCRLQPVACVAASVTAFISSAITAAATFAVSSGWEEPTVGSKRGGNWLAKELEAIR